MVALEERLGTYDNGASVGKIARAAGISVNEEAFLLQARDGEEKRTILLNILNNKRQ